MYITVCTGTRYHPTYLTPTGTTHPPMHTDKAWECINITHGILASVLLSSNTHSSLSHFLCFSSEGLWGSRHPTIPVFHFSVLLLSSCIAHLVQLPQQDLSKVKGSEADPHRNGPFDPVHTETFVESTDSSLLIHNLPHGAQDGSVRVTHDSCSLHAASYHIQRVRRRLADKTCAGSKRQTFIWVGLWAPTVLYMGRGGWKEVPFHKTFHTSNKERGCRKKHLVWAVVAHYLHVLSSVSHR